MKTDLKTTDPEYIEALALKEYPPLDKINIDLVTTRVNKRNGYIQGAKDILSHTNHAELVEAAKAALIWAAEHGMNYEIFCELEEALTKSETSKL